jgi:hypothetical protein
MAAAASFISLSQPVSDLNVLVIESISWFWVRWKSTPPRRSHWYLQSLPSPLYDYKHWLRNQYFNINAQKDSEATARLTRAATLLAKLSVLFLPVSFLTSYFSTQITDLQPTFTAKNYWHAFAVIMSGSFLALFFFSRLLMYVTETLDTWTKHLGEYFTGMFKKKKADWKCGVAFYGHIWMVVYMHWYLNIGQANWVYQGMDSRL